ncbi:MAG: DNA repair protein RecO [Lachnospiraceae bacterium]|nr:DNA repair protein RecO [Lachnospiraceae bacterium]MBR6157310.1 DNA repair protein RecO [Lachnospiraceae bacterium]
MQEVLHTDGMILRIAPANDYDKRVIILTKECGKITAFAKGARRQTNRLMAPTDLFVFGDFKLFPGRNAYSLMDVNVKNFFTELRDDFNAVLYGMYFLEVMEYFTRENNDEREMLALLYQSCRAIIHPSYDKLLVRAVFDLKTIMLQGIFHRDRYRDGYLDTTCYVLDYLLATPPEKVFSFAVREEVIRELTEIAEKEQKQTLNGHSFKSEEMLKVL